MARMAGVLEVIKSYEGYFKNCSEREVSISMSAWNDYWFMFREAVAAGLLTEDDAWDVKTRKGRPADTTICIIACNSGVC